MKQLGLMDSAFINLEQPSTPQHIGGLGIYDPSTAPGGIVRFKQVIANFEARLQKQPLFRTRLVEVPGGVDRPYWVKDANFDVEFHLRHIALPEPGDWRQLCIQVARLHARPIDMSRPLWEAYIIEGLDNIPNLPPGCFAIYTKMHHSLVDGAGGSDFMAAVHDLVPDPDPEKEESEAPRLVDADPSGTELLAKAAVKAVTNSVGRIQSLVSVGRDLGKYAYDIATEAVPPPAVDAPKSIFNRPVGPHRLFDAAEFPLEGFKDIKNVGGVTVNDVALGIISGAMARYMKLHGETVEGSLAASLTVNMRTRRGDNDENNQIGAVFASLHTDISDPLERLRAIHASTQEAKAHGEASPMVDTLKVAGALSPVLVKSLSSFWSRNEISRFIPVNTSTVISNVPGPNFPLYCAGAQLVDYYGLGVLTPGIALFHLVFSYFGKVTISVTADRKLIPDPECYHDCLVQSYEEMYAAAAESLKSDVGKAEIAAKAKIQSPKRKRRTAQKPAAGKSAASRARAKTKVKTKAKAKAKAKATGRAEAKAKANL